MWFTEDPWPPMVLLGVGAMLFLAWWLSSKRVLHLGLAIAALLLAGGVYVLEQAIVTPAEVVEGLVVQLCDEFQRKDPLTLTHFSAQAPELTAMCLAAMSLVEVDNDLRLTDFQSTVTNDGSRVVCHFRANATISVAGYGKVGRQPARFELTWIKEGDTWKITKIRRLHPLKDEELGVLDHTAH
ncbi:hypothetical protein GC163_10025 [bacterium]|nr:hypothetical protein [bacterium]